MHFSTRNHSTAYKLYSSDGFATTERINNASMLLIIGTVKWHSHYAPYDAATAQQSSSCLRSIGAARRRTARCECPVRLNLADRHSVAAPDHKIGQCIQRSALFPGRADGARDPQFRAIRGRRKAPRGMGRGAVAPLH